MLLAPVLLPAPVPVPELLEQGGGYEEEYLVLGNHQSSNLSMMVVSSIACVGDVRKSISSLI